MENIDHAAILLLGMGENQASQVLKHMDPKQVEKVIVKMSAMKRVTQEDINNSLLKFSSASEQETSLGIDTGQYIRSALVDAVGSEKATTIIDKALTETDSSGVKALGWQEAKAILSVIRDEHPQVIAVILTYLDDEKSANVLSEFSDKERFDLMRRIVSIGSVSPQALKEVNDVLLTEVRSVRSFTEIPDGGAKVAAKIINYMKGDVESEVMKNLEEFDVSISERLQGFLFPFEKLAELDKRSLQTLLRDVSSDSLVLALKGVDEEMQKLFFDNMSERAADMLKDDLEAKGPVQLSKVVEAQKEVVAVAQRMAKEGAIVISGAGEEMV